MKQRLAFLYVLLLIVLLSCEVSDETEKALTTPKVSIDLDSIKKRGYITALVDNNSISYFLYKGQSMGYDYELLQLMAEDLGVKLKLRRVSGVENAIKKLNAGEADVLAFPLTITSERKNYVRFTQPHFNSHQVLIQRKPKGWEQMTSDEVNAQLIRNPQDLINKTVHVLNRSSFVSRLKNLSEEIGGEIKIVEDSADAQSESLIQKVAMGEIDLTVADQVIAAVNLSYYPNLDASTVLSLPQQIAWAVRKNSPKLQTAINEWLTKTKKKATFMVIYKRYYKSPRTSLLRANSRYASINGDKLSPYDNLIKEGATHLNWDWRLLAAMIYQESRFNPSDQSWAGARGLMQLMPATAQRFGVSNPDDPRQSILAGVRFLKNLEDYWAKKIADSTQRVKFVLASYNVGLTHITDARKLAIKFQENPADWNVVEKYLLKKSDPAFYKAPEVIAGYCKCEEPVRYVEGVINRFEEYKLHIN